MLIRLTHRFVRIQLRSIGIRSRWIDLDGYRLHYYEHRHQHPRGTLVLLHGLGTSSSTWYHLYSLLLQQYSFVAVDLPGFGFSSTPRGRQFLSLQEQVDCVHAMIQRLGLSSFTLLGHSMGGWIAIKYAAAHPESVNRLILINTAGVYVDGTENLRSIFNIHTTGDVRRLLNAMWFRYPWYFKPFMYAIRTDLVQRRVPELVQSIQRDNFLDDELGTLMMPVHLIWGSEDKLLSPECVRLIKQRVPLSSVDMIDGCGHVPQLEKPEELRKIVGRILA